MLRIAGSLTNSRTNTLRSLPNLQGKRTNALVLSNQQQRHNHNFNSKHEFISAEERDKTRRRSLFIGFAAGTVFLSAALYITEQLLHPEERKEKDRPKVVIVGGGWGGVGCLKELSTARYDVTLISPRSYFLFTPLLPEFTFGKIDASCIAFPIRQVLRFWRKKGVHYCEAVVTNIDPKNQTVTYKTIADNQVFTTKYDKLIMSVGSSYNANAVPGAMDNCQFLKDIQDARLFRKKVLDAFESASVPDQTVENIRRKLHFVVVGGNPSGIRFFHEMNEFVAETSKLYPKLKQHANVTLITNENSGSNTYDKKITDYYVNQLIKQDVVKHPHADVLNQSVKSISKDKIVTITHLGNPDNNNNNNNSVIIKEESIPYGLCVWLSGLSPSPLVQDLQKKNPKEQHNKHALITNEWLQVKGYQNMYAIGECSTVDQGHLLRKWNEIFADLDENGDGFIDEQEFVKLDEKYSREFPQLLAYAAEASRKLFDEGDVNQDGRLSKDEFQSLLQRVDSTLTSFPATAQSALQQGRYLGQSLNSVLRETEVRKLFRSLDEDKSGFLDAREIKRGLRKLHLPYTKGDIEEFIAKSDSNQDNRIDEQEFVDFVLQKQQYGETGDWKKLSHSRIAPFRYRHLGGYEYVGYTSRITDRGSEGKSILDGFGAWWLYNSIYATKIISLSSKAHMFSQLALRNVFGRDLTKDYTPVQTVATKK